MKKFILIIIIFTIFYSIIMAQEESKNITGIGRIEQGHENKQLFFRILPSGGIISPISFIVNEHEGQIIIPDYFNDVVKKFSLDLGFIEKFNLNMYYLMLDRLYLWRDDKIVGASKGFQVNAFNRRGKELFIKTREELGGSRSSDPDPTYQYFPIEDYVFYYSDGWSVNVINETGEFLGHEKAIQLLLEMTEKVSQDYPSERKEKIIELIKTGNYILVGDKYYNSDRFKVKDYWSLMEMEVTNNRLSGFFGFDDDHNSYWRVAGSRTPYTITIVDKEGNLIDIFNCGSMRKTVDGNSVGPQVFVTSSGNLYFMNSYFDGTDFYKIPRTWGIPNMEAIAVNGLLNEEYNEYVKEVLARYSKEELRILRNYIFALYDYAFNSAELQEYFGKFDWYEPVNSINNIQVTPQQKLLIDYILELEKNF